MKELSRIFPCLDKIISFLGSSIYFLISSFLLHHFVVFAFVDTNHPGQMNPFVCSSLLAQLGRLLDVVLGDPRHVNLLLLLLAGLRCAAAAAAAGLLFSGSRAGL